MAEIPFNRNRESQVFGEENLAVDHMLLCCDSCSQAIERQAL